MRVFISGLTGTLGTALAQLHHSRGDCVWGCARNEANAARWLTHHSSIATLYVCDAIRLTERRTDVGRLLPSMDRLYHTAAMKHVDLCERNPREAFLENVDLTVAVALACDGAGVPMVFVSSDKACLPQSIYGATKLIGERVVTQHGGAVVRLGNLIGSSGSVFSLWRDSLARMGRIALTDPEMTRYFISVADAAAFLADEFSPGNVTIPDPMRSVRMGDVARAMAGDAVDVVGRRPGESRHQWLVAPGDQARWGVGRILLPGDGAPLMAGMCSDSAQRWDTDELLAIAGVCA